MLILFLSVIYSHYYSWWNYVNYWNDEFYHQWYHQLFFSITELASTILVVDLCNVEQAATPVKLLTIASIAFVHILVSGLDQFVTNVVMGRGYRFQIIRDLGFMLPDLLHLLVPLLLQCGWGGGVGSDIIMLSPLISWDCFRPTLHFLTYDICYRHKMIGFQAQPRIS